MSECDDLPVYPLPFGRRHRGDWVPLNVDRLLGSRWAATVDPAAGFHGVLLWAEAVRQDPAGTLPDDDRELARLAGLGRDLVAWAAVREGALYGWTAVICVEGEGERARTEVRLGHPVVAQMVEDAMQRMDKRRAESVTGAQRSMLSRLRKRMAGAGLPSAMVARDDVVEGVRQELFRRELQWRAHHIRAAFEAVCAAMDRAEIEAVADLAAARERMRSR